MTTPFFITTAIDYANGEPHHGHAYEKLGADVIARYMRQAGRAVHFLTGLDEHGQKVAQTAEARGLAPQAFVDGIAETFRRMWARLDISYDQFIRTTDASHKRGVRALIERIAERNPDDFYEQTYEGWYCVGCELFKRETEIVDGHCVLHPTRELQWTRGAQLVLPPDEVRRLPARALRDAPGLPAPGEPPQRDPVAARSGTRGSLDHALAARLGDPVPDPVDDRRVAGHVGLVRRAAELPHGDRLSRRGLRDALARAAPRRRQGHHTAAHGRLAGDAEGGRASAPRTGLGARLRAVGRRAFQQELRRHSLDLGEAIDRYGVDAFRYFLLREVPFDGDGNFSWERFDERYTADLANAFGNLASRTIAMVEKYFGGDVPTAPRTRRRRRRRCRPRRLPRRRWTAREGTC